MSDHFLSDHFLRQQSLRNIMPRSGIVLLDGEQRCWPVRVKVALSACSEPNPGSARLLS
jgi:hypothetical protein